MIKGGRGVVRIEMLRHRIAPLMVLDNPERIPDVAVAHPHSILSPGPMGVGTKRCPAKKGPSGWDHGSRQQVPGRQLWVWRGRAHPHTDGVLQSVTTPSTILATPVV